MCAWILTRWSQVDKRAPLVVIEACRSKHLTAWLGGSQSVNAPKHKVSAATFIQPELGDIIPTDVVPLPFWHGKTLGTYAK